MGVSRGLPREERCAAEVCLSESPRGSYCSATCSCGTSFICPRYFQKIILKWPKMLEYMQQLKGKKLSKSQFGGQLNLKMELTQQPQEKAYATRGPVGTARLRLPCSWRRRKRHRCAQGTLASCPVSGRSVTVRS